MRKIIQITTGCDHIKGCVYEIIALCDDGSVWIVPGNEDFWLRLNDIPQDKGKL